MCFTNVAFNIKTEENFLFFVEFFRLKNLLSLLSLFYLNVLRCVIVRAIHTKIAFAVLMAPRRD